MPSGLDALKHIVVLMMSGRSFDHMLGSLSADDPRIDGINNATGNPDTTGALESRGPSRSFKGNSIQFQNHHFPAVDLQIFGGDTSPNRTANMQGFVKSYFNQQEDVQRSHKIMYYFSKENLPVLTSLATNFAVFNRWFASIPGHPVSNRVFAHHGTSFGQVGARVIDPKGKSIFERLRDASHTGKFYGFDEASSSIEVSSLLQRQPQLFGTYDQFLADCKSGTLADYSFIEPNHAEHKSDGGWEVASDQRADHNVQAGEVYIASVYEAIRMNPSLWSGTALLVVYDEQAASSTMLRRPPAGPTAMLPGPMIPASTSPSTLTAWACACPPSLSRRGCRRAQSSIRHSNTLRFRPLLLRFSAFKLQTICANRARTRFSIC